MIKVGSDALYSLLVEPELSNRKESSQLKLHVIIASDSVGQCLYILLIAPNKQQQNLCLGKPIFCLSCWSKVASCV